MAIRELVAYRGEKFTIEWYFDERGRSQSLDYFNSLSEDRQDQVLFLFKRMGDFGRISDITKFRNEGDKIFAFKPQPDRFLCFLYVGRKIIVTNAFERKSQKLPQNEKVRAVACKLDFERRNKMNKYP